MIWICTGDGNLDLAAVSYSSGTLSILLGRGDGTFAPAVNYGIGGSGPAAVIARDFNKDGKIDLAVLANGVSVLLGNGDGTFQSYTSYPLVFSLPKKENAQQSSHSMTQH